MSQTVCMFTSSARMHCHYCSVLKRPKSTADCVALTIWDWPWRTLERVEDQLFKKKKQKSMTTILCVADRLQTGQEIELWQEPQPGLLLTIACDSRCVILSTAWHSPRRCVITGDCHNLVSKSRRGLWPGLRCCQLWAFLKLSTSVCGCWAAALR